MKCSKRQEHDNVCWAFYPWFLWLKFVNWRNSIISRLSLKKRLEHAQERFSMLHQIFKGFHFSVHTLLKQEQNSRESWDALSQLFCESNMLHTPELFPTFGWFFESPPLLPSFVIYLNKNPCSFLVAFIMHLLTRMHFRCYQPKSFYYLLDKNQQRNMGILQNETLINEANTDLARWWPPTTAARDHNSCKVCCWPLYEIGILWRSEVQTYSELNW